MEDMMTFEEWVEKCKPQGGGGYIYVYETFGAHMDFINKQQFVCTVLDWGEGSWIVSGLHYVNRLGYIVCENDYEEEINIEVTDEIRDILLYTVCMQ